MATLIAPNSVSLACIGRNAPSPSPSSTPSWRAENRRGGSVGCRHSLFAHLTVSGRPCRQYPPTHEWAPLREINLWEGSPRYWAAPLPLCAAPISAPVSHPSAPQPRSELQPVSHFSLPSNWPLEVSIRLGGSCAAGASAAGSAIPASIFRCVMALWLHVSGA